MTFVPTVPARFLFINVQKLGEIVVKLVPINSKKICQTARRLNFADKSYLSIEK